VGPTRHQITEDGQDYSLFSIHCGTCGVVLYEFVHKQVFVGYTPYVSDDRVAYLISQPRQEPDLRTPSGYAQAQSWCSAKLRAKCHEMTDGSRVHTLEPCREGQDLNQNIRSRGMNDNQFQEWVKANDRANKKEETPCEE
jgi:hypothetical protein